MCFYSIYERHLCTKPRNKPLPGAFIASLHGIKSDRHGNKRIPEVSILSVEDIIWAMHGYRPLLGASLASMGDICAKCRFKNFQWFL